MNTSKQSYIAPELTVVTVATERGFAESITMLRRDIELIIDWNPIQSYTAVNDGSRDYSNPINTSADPNWQPSNNFWNF